MGDKKGCFWVHEVIKGKYCVCCAKGLLQAQCFMVRLQFFNKDDIFFYSISVELNEVTPKNCQKIFGPKAFKRT